MNRIPVFVGLDYHEKSIQVCVEDADQQVLLNRRCENDSRRVIALVQRHGRPAGVAIEACCGAADLAEELIQGAGWSVDLAHPGYVARMKQNPDKTDFSDARMLADLERVGYLPRVWLAPLEIRELRRVVRHRQQLVNDRRAVKLRIGALLREHRIKSTGLSRWTQPWLRWLTTLKKLPEQSRWLMDQYLQQLTMLNGQILVVEARLMEITQDDEAVHHLLDQPGVGPVTAWMLRAEIGRFDRFRTGKQLSRFCGLSPRNASSGSRQADAGLIKAGNRALRAVLIQAAHRLMNQNEYWSSLADRLMATGKPKSVVTAAIANRWIRRLFHQMKETVSAA